MSIDFLQTQIGAAKSLAEILDNVAERKTWRFRNPDSKVQQKHNHSHWFSISYPIGSMHAIYGNIYHQYTPNVSIYTIHGSLYHIRIVQWTPPKKFLQWPKICSFHVQPLYKHTTHTHTQWNLRNTNCFSKIQIPNTVSKNHINPVFHKNKHISDIYINPLFNPYQSILYPQFWQIFIRSASSRLGSTKTCHQARMMISFSSPSASGDS